MQRGFLNTPRSKRVIEEAYTPQSPPGPEPSRQPKTSSSPSIRRTQDGGAKAAATQDAMDVDPTVVKDTPFDQAGSRKDENGTSDKAEQHPKGNNDPKGKGKANAVDVDDDDAMDEPHPETKDRKGKGKEKADDMDFDFDGLDMPEDEDTCEGTIPPRPPPRRPGWGRDPREEFFHQVPPSHGGTHKKRAVFRLWPRDPKGEPLVPNEKLKGTLSPDGYPWGATLYDIYHVNRIPGVTGLMSVMTGSALCQAVTALGELDAAAPEIEWSMLEGKPRMEGVADTEELIRCIDTRLHLWPSLMKGMMGMEMEMDEEEDEEDQNEEDSEEESDDEVVPVDNGVEPKCIPPPPTIPVTSPFHPSHYPKPWPFVPFSKTPSILLQERIPLYLLPQTLYVHDPFCLLSARKRTFPDTSWTSRPDIIRTYKLNLSESVRREIEAARVKAEELEEFKARTLIILRYQRTKEQIKNYDPIIEVPFPAYQRRMTKVEESHLYVSPVAKVGEGHHSIVYKGEWELPREMFTKPTICPLCFKESADKEIKRLKDTGRWQKLMRAAAWGPKGFTGRKPTKAELNEVNDPTNLARDGEIIERELTCFVPPNIAPAQVVELLDEKDIWNTWMKNRSANSMHLQFTRGDEDESAKNSYVAVVRIDPQYVSQNNCTHKVQMHQFPAPRTAKFTVVAKLSLEHDLHLAREASNYQKFPEHLFHHYNGYTIISQLHTIVPVNAVVPQFYGYYVPKKDKEGSPGQPSYLSPILLLEHCGNPINPEKLSVEDQEECASMLLRFQRAGWLHESVAPRNFLVQRGKPTEFPLSRQVKPERSFRLIDFGRSRKYETAAEKRGEEMETLRMFERLNGKMAVTLSM
ncbi:hypothetical protein OG21DRAFT_277328 [Imleria badia]|nr:hypothetical protein OG21DRAFT_277328 [Imleria badia]